MDVTAFGADVTGAGRVRPVEIEKARRSSVQLSLSFEKAVVAANDATQRLSLHFD
jgi:hypothetical protein